MLLLLSPGRCSQDDVQALTKYFVERAGQSSTGASPAANTGQTKRRRTAKPGRVEILVGNRVSPAVEHFQLSPTSNATRIELIHHRPEIEAKAAEVCADVRGVGVA